MMQFHPLRLFRPLVRAALCVAALASASLADEIVHLGVNAPGTVTVSKTGSVYSLRFNGDEVIDYRIDLNDTYVSDGRIHVYEVSSSAWLMDAAWGYRDSVGGTHALGWLSGYASLTGETMTANSVVLNYTDNFSATDIRHRRVTYTLRGKMLSVRLQDLDARSDYLNNYIGVLQGSQTLLETPKILKMLGQLAIPVVHFRNGPKHYYFSSVLDFYNSNAADYFQSATPGNPTASTTSINYSFSTWGQYAQLSDPTKVCAPMDDTFNILVSGKVEDTWITPAHPPSPYRNLLTNRTVLLLGGTEWAQYQSFWNLLDQWGLDNIAGYCFYSWSAAANDAPAGQNLGPDWWPPFNPSGFTAMMQQGIAKGYLLGAYQSFHVMPASAPPSVNNPSHWARFANGNPKLNIQTGHPLISSTASGIHAQSEANLLRTNTGASLAYLDIQTYGSPTRGASGNHIDEIATSPWAKTLRRGIADQHTWMRGLQDQFQGPLLGEGSINGKGSNYEFLWAGYCDSTQRVINTGTEINNLTLPDNRRGQALSPTGWPVIPELDWRVFAPLQVNHGNGFPDRFFSPPDGPAFVHPNGLPIYPMTEAAMDRYRIYELTYGKAGHAQTNGIPGPSGNPQLHPDFVKEYHMTNALQSRYTERPPDTIQYMHEGSLKSFQRIIEETSSFEAFRDAQIKLQFQNGLTMWLNHAIPNWTVVAGGVTYQIPQDGFVAIQPSSNFLSFSAIPPGTGGKRIDYCLAPESYEFFDGRGQVSGWGGQTSPIAGVSWTAFTRGRTFREVPGNTIAQVGSSSPPALLRVEVRPSLLDLPVGQRAGAKAFAVYSNGSQRDVTKLVTWSTTASAIATVNNGAALTGVSPGVTSLRVSSYLGSPSIAASVNVH